MRKILSTLLVVAMIVSMFAVFSIPAAAVEGMFDTHGRISNEQDDFDGDKNPVPGYEYTEDGFHMTAADWSTATCFSHMSTKEKVNLKDGVYMEVRLDEWGFQARDKWVNFSIWSLPAIDEGSGDPKHGEGVQTLIRYSNGFGNIDWHLGTFDSSPKGGRVAMSNDGKTLANEEHVLYIEIKWDGSNYRVEINGSVASDKVVQYMNENYGGDDSYAHVGFTMYHDTIGGTQEATITKYGTSKETATTPRGDDEKEPEDNVIVIADIADESEIPAGAPAVLMTGDKLESDLKSTPTSTIGAQIAITDDLLVHVVGKSSRTDCGIWKVKNEVSYDVVDFPVIMIMSRDFCSCPVENKCFGYETVGIYVATGDAMVPNEGAEIKGLSAYEAKCFEIDGHGYVFFTYDLTSMLKTEENPDGIFSGRINSTSVHFATEGVLHGFVGANEFDVVMQGFFRSTEDAEAYALNYLKEAGYEGDIEPPVGGDNTDTTEPEGGDTTEPKVDDTTEPKVDDTTEPKVDDTTEPKVDDTTEPKVDDTTEPKADDTTEAPKKPAQTEKAPTTGNDDSSSGSCGSTIGFGAIAIVALIAGVGYVSFKKKD